MSTRWADDYATIRARMQSIKEDEVPRCPQTPTMTLHACLRSSAQCSAHCPHRNDWIGPQAEKAG